MAATSCELKWLNGIMTDIGKPQLGHVHLYCDNQAALHITANPVFHEQTKHIEVDFHFIRDEEQAGHIITHYVHTSHQLADILTKALNKHQFDLHAPT